ncbi:hypothetical protein LMG28614_06250 [Paraburkholderia ultramafica]|uniref:Uncharacterized protein n=1 Tax=Paraburkholderia ultramafica TaxID=1544867 RepID=A0A6S7BM77_9BURK|nr:hypothetical protein LMG28614_06250 [Paraburkholderia ultramafica]
MKQQTLVMAVDQGAGFETHAKPTRRHEFLYTTNVKVPWAQAPPDVSSDAVVALALVG